VATHENRGVTETRRIRERLEARITGTVQGVGFRWFVVRKASDLGLTGWTANEPDGSVHVVAEGTPSSLDELENLLGEGPAGAHVEKLDSVRMAPTGEFSVFGIRSRAHRGD
jgi:acylphosphatase